MAEGKWGMGLVVRGAEGSLGQSRSSANWEQLTREGAERLGHKNDTLTTQLLEAEARADEAESILIRVVQQANTHAVDGDDGFIAAYHMPVGPVHAAIPFLQRRGIYVDEFGGIHRASTEQTTQHDPR